MIAPSKASFGLRTKKWTKTSDDKSDKLHGIKENSRSDMKLDAKRGLKPDLASSLAKLRGVK